MRFNPAIRSRPGCSAPGEEGRCNRGALLPRERASSCWRRRRRAGRGSQVSLSSSEAIQGTSWRRGQLPGPVASPLPPLRRPFRRSGMDCRVLGRLSWKAAESKAVGGGTRSVTGPLTTFPTFRKQLVRPGVRKDSKGKNRIVEAHLTSLLPKDPVDGEPGLPWPALKAPGAPSPARLVGGSSRRAVERAFRPSSHLLEASPGLQAERSPRLLPCAGLPRLSVAWK